MSNQLLFLSISTILIVFFVVPLLLGVLMIFFGFHKNPTLSGSPRLKPIGTYSPTEIRDLIRPKQSSIKNLITKAKQNRSKFIILTAGSWDYRDSVLNWISHMENLGIYNYIVLSHDKRLHNYLGASHSISLFDMNQSIFEDILVAGPSVIFRKNGTSKVQPFRDRSNMVLRILTILKFEAISALLNSNLTVIWSDSDAIWRDRCALDYLLSTPNNIDIVGQRALSPISVSELTGSALCVGFMMLRPSISLMRLVDACKEKVWETYFFKSSLVKEDQHILNELLYVNEGFGRLRSATPSSSSNSFFGIPLKSNQHEDKAKQSVLEFNSSTKQLNFPVRFPYNAPGNQTIFTNSIQSIESKTLLRIGLLPYSFFPRGRPGLPLTFGLNITMKQKFKLEQKQKAKVNIQATKPRREREMEILRRLSPDEIVDISQLSIPHRNHQNGEVERRKLPSEENSPEDRYWQYRPEYSRAVDSAVEWKKFQQTACIWHMLTVKSGEAKVEAMQRDGVWYDEKSTHFKLGSSPTLSSLEADLGFP